MCGHHPGDVRLDGRRIVVETLQRFFLDTYPCADILTRVSQAFWLVEFAGLPLTKRGDFVPISAGRGAAPLTPVVFGGVIEIKRTGHAICAPMKVLQVRIR